MLERYLFFFWILCSFFFFKQKTAYEMRISDWSSDVCSSDLLRGGRRRYRRAGRHRDVAPASRPRAASGADGGQWRPAAEPGEMTMAGKRDVAADQLHAYADGRLSADRRAAVGAWHTAPPEKAGKRSGDQPRGTGRARTVKIA